jgi:hypothetical protein
MATPSLLLIPDRYKSGVLYSQLPESGAGDIDFTRASAATRVNASGLIESVASGVPRLDYTGGGCPSLLLEPQRTNLALYSEQFDNAAWIKTDVTITANDAISPDGTQNADLYLATGVDARIQSSLTSVSGVVYTISVFVKNIDAGVFRIDMASVAAGPVFNFSTKTFTSVANWTAGYEEYSNGWLRLYASREATTALAIPQFSLDSSTSGSVYIYGAQYEEGSYPTSYIPTTSAAVTRAADLASKTGISSLIGVNQGSIYLEFDANGLSTIDTSYIFDLSDNVNFDQNRISMYWGITSNDLRFFYGYGGTFSESIYNFNFATTKKIGVRWTSTQIQVVVNGVAQTPLTYGNSSPTKLNLASRFNDIERLASNIKVCALYNNTLSTAELIALTTL